jgi:GDP-mannose 6-dehydrogenase
LLQARRAGRYIIGDRVALALQLAVRRLDPTVWLVPEAVKVLVLGLGYVGSTMAACLAKSGHTVVGIDTNPGKLARVAAGRSPVREPEVDALLAAALGQGLLLTAVDIGDHVLDADLAVVCVGTPSRPNGLLDMSQVAAVAGELGTAVCRRPAEAAPLLCIFRSTMLPGTMETLVIPRMAATAGAPPGDRYEVAFNPEFLRESVAVADYFRPPKIVVGERQRGLTQRLRGLYDGIDAPLFEVPFRVAEMIKMVDNTFHALKVTFANEIGRVAAAAAVDVDQLMALFLADRKLNISEAYLRPGGPFGGSCLPKDVAALCAFARSGAVDAPVIGHVLQSNATHQASLIQRVTAALPAGGPVLLAGITFKAGTDDLRESPMVYLARSLVDRGHSLMIYDQDLNDCDLVGENLRFVRQHLPEIFDLLVDDLEQALRGKPVVVRAKPLPVPAPAGLKIIDVDAL